MQEQLQEARHPGSFLMSPRSLLSGLPPLGDVPLSSQYLRNKSRVFLAKG